MGEHSGSPGPGRNRHRIRLGAHPGLRRDRRAFSRGGLRRRVAGPAPGRSAHRQSGMRAVDRRIPGMEERLGLQGPSRAHQRVDGGAFRGRHAGKQSCLRLRSGVLPPDLEAAERELHPFCRGGHVRRRGPPAPDRRSQGGPHRDRQFQ